MMNGERTRSRGGSKDCNQVASPPPPSALCFLSSSTLFSITPSVVLAFLCLFCIFPFLPLPVILFLLSFPSPLTLFSSLSHPSFFINLFILLSLPHPSFCLSISIHCPLSLIHHSLSIPPPYPCIHPSTTIFPFFSTFQHP